METIVVFTIIGLVIVMLLNSSGRRPEAHVEYIAVVREPAAPRGAGGFVLFLMGLVVFFIIMLV